jgi:crotonobetainyl-CoA:carnitine CoA-transferase CaiB-like acyl-CoA transferase
VVKVESTRRPDGARFGPPLFFDLLNAGKESVALDFGTAAGRAQLRRLVECADIVVESARPRALAQVGIDAESLVEEAPGLTWVSITGYGRRDPGAGWVAFGDDAGVAAGLAAATASPGGPPLFCGDAIADPLTGIHAGLAALACWRGGGGLLLDLALCNVAAHALAFGPTPPGATVCSSNGGWEVVAGSERAEVASPRARATQGTARTLGADSDAVLEEFTASC